VNTATSTPKPGRWGSWAIGPGLVFVLATFGPQDFLVNAIAGANHRYSLLWTLALLVAARYMIVEASARYVIVTGESLMSGYARAGRWVSWLILVSILLKRHLTNLYHILLLGSGLDMVFTLPFGNSRMIWAVVSISFGFWVMFRGKYSAVEKFSRPLALLLGGSLIIAAAGSGPKLGAVAHGILIPTVPESYGYSYALVLLALIGAQVGGISNLKYAAFTHEKGWRTLPFLKALRCDVLLGAFAMYILILLVQVVAATTLSPDINGFKSVEDLAPMFTTALGSTGRIVFGICLWAIVFSTYIGSNTGYALLVSDAWNEISRRTDGVQSTESTRSLANRPAYHWALLWFCISPLYVLLTDWQPLLLVIITAVLMGLLLPFTVSVLLWLTSSKARMGEYANSWLVNTLMAGLVLATLYTAWQTASGLRGGF